MAAIGQRLTKYAKEMAPPTGLEAMGQRLSAAGRIPFYGIVEARITTTCGSALDN